MSDPNATLENSDGRPCFVCGTLTDSTSDVPDNEVLCLIHFFDDDYSEYWEQDDAEE